MKSSKKWTEYVYRLKQSVVSRIYLKSWIYLSQIFIGFRTQIKMMAHLLQTDTSRRCRVYVKSILIRQCPSVRLVDRNSKFIYVVLLKIFNCESIYFISFRSPGTRTLCDALVHILPLVQINHLGFSARPINGKNSLNYQIETETCSGQGRHPISSVITLGKLAVECETVPVRGTWNSQKVPVVEFAWI